MEAKLEEKEIRGLSFKTLVTVVVSTISFVTSILFAYFAIVEKVNALNMQRANDKEVLQITIETLRSKISTLETQTKSLSDRIDYYQRSTQQPK